MSLDPYLLHSVDFIVNSSLDNYKESEPYVVTTLLKKNTFTGSALMSRTLRVKIIRS